MSISPKEAAAKLRRIVRDARGDDYERAQIAFSGMTVEEGAKMFGQSGKTNQQVLDGYRDERAGWQAANELLEALLKMRGL